MSSGASKYFPASEIATSSHNYAMAAILREG